MSYLELTVGMILFWILILGFIIDIRFCFFLKKNTIDKISTDVLWGFSQVLFIVFLYLFYEYALWRLQAAAILFINFDGISTALLVIINNVILYMVVLLTLWEFCCKNNGIAIKEYFKFNCFFKNIFKGIVGYIGFVPLVFVLGLLSLLIAKIFNIQIVEQGIVTILKKEDSIVGWVFLSILIVFLAPIVEEVFFRGFLYPVIKRRTGMKWAIVINALFFSLLHWNYFVFLPIIGVGIAVTIIYETTGSIISAIAFHLCHNLSSVVLLIIFHVVK